MDLRKFVYSYGFGGIWFEIYDKTDEACNECLDKFDFDFQATPKERDKVIDEILEKYPNAVLDIFWVFDDVSLVVHLVI